MKSVIPIYHELEEKVKRVSKRLNFDKYVRRTGRKLALSIWRAIALGLFKQMNGIPTKRQLYELFGLSCSYKTLVVSLNRWYKLAMLALHFLFQINNENSHIIKHIDSTDIPVCRFKNANAHKTMKSLASFRKEKSKPTYYGLKLHLVSDLKRNILKIKFTSANVDDRKPVPKILKGIKGIIVADAGYVSHKLEQDVYVENERIFLAKPRSNMKKIMTKTEESITKTRMLIELNFRSLKIYHNLITSMPRSVNGYFANYIYSILAYCIS